jgi:L-seryl-tRNA(Ser) seleniumtransferase
MAGVDLRRRVPSVDEVLRDPRVRALEGEHGPERLRHHLRVLLEEVRGRAARGDAAGVEALLPGLADELQRRVERAAGASLVRVINATGVVVHTNLGRAPLPPEAAARVAEIASGYSNLEFDLDEGGRGRREVHAEARLGRMLGAEGSLVVNNNAAAVLLAVNTLAEGREVLVSRGELVEIGGSFRIPEVLRKGGARLREVGTTNRTRAADFRAAIGPDTALILKVHPSNFRIVGFTEEPALAELVDLAREARLPLAEDLGSGLLGTLPAGGMGAQPRSGLSPHGPRAGIHSRRELPDALRDEPAVASRLRAGVDVVTFSGDKLLGGPQAGLVVGRRAPVDAMRRNPLYRALRVDKMTLAALDVVLGEHEAGRAARTVPVVRMLWSSAGELRARAQGLVDALRARCPSLEVGLREGASAVGGGAAPTVELETVLVSLACAPEGPDAAAAALRAGRPPVVARVAEDRLLLDLRTVDPAEEPALLDALAAVFR